MKQNSIKKFSLHFFKYLLKNESGESLTDFWVIIWIKTTEKSFLSCWNIRMPRKYGIYTFNKGCLIIKRGLWWLVQIPLISTQISSLSIVDGMREVPLISSRYVLETSEKNYLKEAKFFKGKISNRIFMMEFPKFYNFFSSKGPNSQRKSKEKKCFLTLLRGFFFFILSDTLLQSCKKDFLGRFREEFFEENESSKIYFYVLILPRLRRKIQRNHKKITNLIPIKMSLGLSKLS